MEKTDVRVSMNLTKMNKLKTHTAINITKSEEAEIAQATAEIHEQQRERA